MKKKKLYFSIIITILFVVFCFLFIKNIENKNISKINVKQEINNIKYIKIANKILKVELADTEEEQIKGLSGRQKIENGTGMLFVFKKPSVNYFWMKDMNFPIDIIWIDENFQIINIEKNVKPESYPTTFGPKEDSKYVLEVEALFSEKNNLKLGEKVEFLP